MSGFPEQVKRDVAKAQNNYCKGLNCVNPIHSIHHKLRNTVPNRKRFPKFINSVFNGVGLCVSCHTNNSHIYAITFEEAEIYEQFLTVLTKEER